MRAIKWTVTVVVVIAIIATALYVRRDYVARELANSLLSDTELEIAELSVGSLGTDRMVDELFGLPLLVAAEIGESGHGSVSSEDGSTKPRGMDAPVGPAMSMKPVAGHQVR